MEVHHIGPLGFIGAKLQVDFILIEFNDEQHVNWMHYGNKF